MHNDNVYPNSGRPFVPVKTPSQKAADERSESEVLNEVPLIKKTVKQLDKAIFETDSVKLALAIAKKYNTTTENALMALDIANDLFIKERNYIATKVISVKRG